jgi:glucosamine--fructose-6-phosphate aminotransferase (isomerizing)
MCGIIGFIGSDRAAPILIHGLRRLEYRGYDSAGLVTIDKSRFQSAHACEAGESIDRLARRTEEEGALGGSVGIAHTRWATHGNPCTKNAHPHFDADRKIAVVHNGTIENYLELKTELEAAGVPFASETDTEVIPQLIAHIRKESRELAFLDVLRRALGRLRGTFGLAILREEEPDRLYVARRSSPMVIGVTDGAAFIASEAMAFARYTRTITELEDGEIAVLTAGEFHIHDGELAPVRRGTSQFEWSDEEAQKGGHPFYMRKEILEQPETLRNAMRGRLDEESGTARLGGLQSVDDRLKTCERIMIVGCGTAYHAGLYGKRIIETLARIPVEVDLSNEFIYRDALIDERTALVAVSQSGETLETRYAVTEAKRKGALALGIVNRVGTSIPRETDAGVYCHSGPEIGVASTKAFVAQATIFALIGLRLGRMGPLSLSDGRALVRGLERLPELAERVLAFDDQLKELAVEQAKCRGTMYLGRGLYQPIALEGALKLKEIAYVHADGYAAGEMKHGPLALIEEGYPCFVFCPHDALYEKSFATVSELVARGAKVIALTDDARSGDVPKASITLRLPQAHPLLMPILSVIPLQLYAYHVSVARGLNPDKPRNLAKSVTVE